VASSSIWIMRWLQHSPTLGTRMRFFWSKAGLVALCLAFVLTAAAAFTNEATSSVSRTQKAVVVASVYDGDTLRLRDGRRVRLLQIDTPELGSGECYSRAARTALLSLAPPGRPIVLESDPALDRVDRYGRLLRYVKRNGVNVNLELVRRGAAAPYFYRGERGRYAASLMRTAQRAKAAKRGLWKACPSTVLDPTHAVETGRSGPPTSNPPPSGSSCSGRAAQPPESSISAGSSPGASRRSSSAWTLESK
jgi:endonuclease YncB( thermonuclease family)